MKNTQTTEKVAITKPKELVKQAEEKKEFVYPTMKTIKLETKISNGTTFIYLPKEKIKKEIAKTGTEYFVVTIGAYDVMFFNAKVVREVKGGYSVGITNTFDYKLKNVKDTAVLGVNLKEYYFELVNKDKVFKAELEKQGFKLDESTGEIVSK